MYKQRYCASVLAVLISPHANSEGEMSTTYEWTVEQTDGPGLDADILQVHFFPTLQECIGYAEDFDHFNIALTKMRGNDIAGITERDWAYLTAEGLPEVFPEGGKIPARFRLEAKTASGRVSA